MHKYISKSKKEREDHLLHVLPHAGALFFKPREIPLCVFQSCLYAMRSIIHATLRQHLLNKRARTTFSSLVEKTMQMREVHYA